MRKDERTTSERLQAIRETIVAIVGTVFDFVWENIFGFIFGAVIIAGLIIVALFGSVFTPEGRRATAETEFYKRDLFVQACLESETYTRDECITLASKQE